MPQPINLGISYIANVDVSNNIQHLNSALVAAKSTDLEEQVRKNEEAQSQVNTANEYAQSKEIKDQNKNNFHQESQKREKNKKGNSSNEEHHIVVDEYRGHTLDIRI
ncbi:hypothetical protein XO10_03680 [Marinitoga sp. 1135]|uniref:Uncharacterized protein n=1 Tax=Marinitoga piezophila (strain DSM 14283 / JCM 11233 / KA3) TaxID=443254 RepID=H2J6H9_MARPK|nr:MULTISPECIES: hypothetical protein [Marinitoga]AEX85164.1 hypothetical protein Marpi_0730 [Marinitoga piezophila KA3]APT75661.1 hypothetical protein LN42_04100 [Marinitoga sp. 1137]NUU95400.1 hypothetical protein [Marinitoga sp. 1135]NUU97328.1 hypothetical protein [Marinitoga sp. 1138]